MSASPYAHPELLAEPDWSWAHRDDPDVRMVDMGSVDAYGRAHIAGAVRFPIHGWIKETEGGVHVLNADTFAELMTELGVTSETTVVAYDSFNTSFATRLWWTLNYYGHAKVKVLNGGLGRWLSEGRPVTQALPRAGRGGFVARADERIRCRLEDVKAAIGDPNVQILNVLPEGWYRGTTNPFGNERVGRIPGSLNLPIERFFTDDDRRVFRSADELWGIVREAGLSPDHGTIIHCQAGIRTTVAFFVLKLLGWENVRAYDASMAEWANRDDTPLVTG